MIVILLHNCSFCAGLDWTLPLDENEDKVHGGSNEKERSHFQNCLLKYSHQVADTVSTIQHMDAKNALLSQLGCDLSKAKHKNTHFLILSIKNRAHD